MDKKRVDGRGNSDMRPLKITRFFQHGPAGSVLIELGNTKVICAATVEQRLPNFRRNQNGESKGGWLKAEYTLLPSATATRTPRESVRGKQNGRTHEIQRLIGRSLRSVLDMKALGERTITIDCDVLQGDGGTRTASVTGGFVALALACQWLVEEGYLHKSPIIHHVAGVSAGIIDETPMLDLPYAEDSRAQVDLNCIMNELGEIIEIQGTGEGRAFSMKEQQELLELCLKGNRELIRKQREVLGES